MIEVERFEGKIPSIAYTNYKKVYISNVITSIDEYDVLYRHECAHIWLQHQLRGDSLAKLEKESFDLRRWGIAADLEIALHIYDANDDAIINRPRSNLKSGISKKHLKDYADCVFAEDFYFKQAEKALENNSHDGEANEEARKENDIEESKKGGKNEASLIEREVLIENEVLIEREVLIENEVLIEIAKKEIEKHKVLSKSAIQKHEILEETKRFLPKASLAGEIDKHLGRVALDRITSYKRPNRREGGDFIKKGTVSKEMTPLVTIYVDRSGSFCEKKTRGANKQLNRILLKYRAKIRKDVIFFHDTLFYEEPESSGGTNYLDVARDIAKSSSKLAIIITDDDNCDIQCKEILENCKTNILVLAIGCLKTKVATIFNAKEIGYEE